MADRFKNALARIEKAKAGITAAINGRLGAQSKVDVATGIVRLIRSWNPKKDIEVAEWQEAVAIISWRQGLDLRFAEKAAGSEKDNTALRALARYLTGCSAREASEIAKLVSKTRKSSSSKVGETIKGLGGVDNVLYDRKTAKRSKPNRVRTIAKRLINKENNSVSKFRLKQAPKTP